MFENLPSTSDGFNYEILSQSLTALKLNTFTDNFDARRFNFDGIDRSRYFDVQSTTFSVEWFFGNRDKLFSAYAILNNEESKRLYLHLIAFRLASHFCIKLPMTYLDDTESNQAYLEIEKSKESTLNTRGVWGKLRHWDFIYKDKHYVVDCLSSLDQYLLRGQYFYHRNGVSVQPELGDFVVDGGACVGDTAVVFSNAVGPSGKIYAFDPVADHLEVLQHNIKQHSYANIVAMPYGLSNRTVDAPLMVLDKYNPGFNSTTQDVPLRTIDSLIDSGEMERVDFIKLDVEGSEMAALQGAFQSIRKFRPKMAISLYHKTDDLFELIAYLNNKHPFYDLYIGHYTIHAEETVLYCSPSNRELSHDVIFPMATNARSPLDDFSNENIQNTLNDLMRCSDPSAFLFERTQEIKKRNKNLMPLQPSGVEDVSILMPIYNHEGTLSAALNSILAQETSYSYVIYCMNDASSDGSAVLLEEYARKYPEKIRIYSNKNNLGSAKRVFYHHQPPINGKYWCILEGDDFWISNDKLQKQLEWLDANEDYTGCGSHTVIKNEITGIDGCVTPISKDWNLFDLLLHRNKLDFYTHPSSIVWRNVFLVHGFFLPPELKNDFVKGDTFLMHLMLGMGGKMHIIPERLSCYRYSGNGIWSSKSRDEQDALNDELFKNIDSVITDKYRMLLQLAGSHRFFPKPAIEL